MSVLMSGHLIATLCVGPLYQFCNESLKTWDINENIFFKQVSHLITIDDGIVPELDPIFPKIFNILIIVQVLPLKKLFIFVTVQCG